MSRMGNLVLEIQQLLVEYPHNTYEQIASYVSGATPEMVKDIDDEMNKNEDCYYG